MAGVEADIALIEGLMAFANTKHSKVIADRAGVDPGTLQKKLNGQDHNRLSQRTIEKLRAAFPSYPGWSAHAIAETRLPYRPQEPIPLFGSLHPDLAPVREIDLNFGMGATYLDVPITEEVHQFPRAWLRRYTRSSPDRLFFAQGIGDSMEPTLYDSDLLLIDTSQDTLNASEKIWAIAYADCGMIKRLRPVPGGGVEVWSDKKEVSPFTAYDGELKIIGRVVAYQRKL